MDRTMGVTNHAVIFTCLLFMAIFSSVQGLRCYRCTHAGATSTPCVTDPRYITGVNDMECAGQCYSIRQVTKLTRDLYSVTRWCDATNSTKDGDMDTGSMLIKTRTCLTNYCNGEDLTYTPPSTTPTPTTTVTTTREPQVSECPPGYYLNGKCMACPTGSYQPLNVSKEDPFARACKLCPSGLYCDGPGVSAGRRCQSGHYCPQGCGYGDGLPCLPNFYCFAGSGVPIPCVPSGTISPPGTTSNLYCSDKIPCPPGQYKNGKNECTDCPRGTFQPSWVHGDINYCQPCPPGSYCINTRLDAPSGLCVFPGYYCPIRSTSPTDTKCPKGFYCPGGSLFPIACPTGMISEPGAAALSDCRKSTFECPSGYITEGIFCKPCPEGTYGSTGKCVTCPGGKYCSGLAKAAPSGLCSSGYYCPEGSTSPTTVLCPDDHYCTEGSANATKCSSGTRSYQGSSSCSSNVPALCEAGYYNNRGRCLGCYRGYYKPTKDRSGRDACLPCPPGFWCQYSGIAAPEGTCFPGHFCPLTSRRGNVMVCPHDHYCPEASPVPVPCPDGKRSPLNSDSISRCI